MLCACAKHKSVISRFIRSLRRSERGRVPSRSGESSTGVTPGEKTKRTAKPGRAPSHKTKAHGQSRSCVTTNTSRFGFGNGDSPGAAHLVSDLSRLCGHHSDLLAGHLTPFRRRPQSCQRAVLYELNKAIVRHAAANCKSFFAFSAKKPGPRSDDRGPAVMRFVVPRSAVYLLSLMAACAAARRAMGTRKGEQDT